MPCRYSGAGKMNRSLLRMALTTRRPTVIGSCGRAQNGPASTGAGGRWRRRATGGTQRACWRRAAAAAGALRSASGRCVSLWPMLVCVMPGISVEVPMFVMRRSSRSCSIKPVAAIFDTA